MILKFLHQKLQKSPAMQLVAVFVFFFALFLSVHAMKQGFWMVDDPYYHAKHSYLMAQSQDFTLVKPWLAFHFFSYAPNDPWWGYHLIGAWFVGLFGVILGFKIYTAVLSSLIFTVFYHILKRIDCPRAFVWTSLLLGSSAFFQIRIMAERPFLLAMIALPLAFLWLVEKKYRHLFGLTLIFALLYHFVLPLVLFACFYVLVEFLSDKKINFRPVIATGSGTLAGIFIHPNSLNYFFVIFVHFWEVLYLRLSGTDLGIGAEIQATSFVSFLSENVLVLGAFILSTSLFIAFKGQREQVADQFLFVLALIWFLVTLTVPRGIDFFVPFTWLFTARAFTLFARSAEWPLLVSRFKTWPSPRIIKFFSVAGVLALVGLNFFSTYVHASDGGKGNGQDAYYEQAGDWLKAHTPGGSVIFYNNWSFWPRMFYFNDANRYVIGMDPTFLYEYDHELFWLWSNISRAGAYCMRQDGCPDASPREKMSLVKYGIKEGFGADYALVGNFKQSSLVRVMESRKQDFEKVFENKALLIYKIN